MIFDKNYTHHCLQIYQLLMPYVEFMLDSWSISPHQQSGQLFHTNYNISLGKVVEIRSLSGYRAWDRKQMLKIIFN